MAFKPLAQAAASGTANSFSNTQYVYFTPGSLALVTITDANTAQLGTIILPPTNAGGQVIIRKRPTDLIASNIALTCTAGTVTGTEKMPILQVQSNTVEVNATSFTTVFNSRQIAITTTTPTLLTLNDGANNTFASMVLPGNNIMIVLKRSDDKLISNAVSFATKVGASY